MYQLLYSTNAGLKRIRFSRLKVTLLVIPLILLLLGMGYLMFAVLPPVFLDHQLQHMRNENANLVNKVKQLQARANILEWRLSVMQNHDDAYRTYSDVSTLNPDIRHLGIGGIRYDKTIKLDYLLPESKHRISDLLIDVDKITRMTKLQELSFKKIESATSNQKSKIASTPSIRPVETGYFSDGFGYRIDPFTHRRRFHYGLDISTRRGTPIHAAADGVVRYAKRNGGYGLMVAIDHGHGFRTLYGHMSKILVRPGKHVTRGEKIGLVGNTGRSTGSHLHYEVKFNGKQVNPIDYFFSGYIHD